MLGNTPFSPGFSDISGESRHSLQEVSMSINEKIERLLGYEFTNEYLIRFMSEFGHPDQLKCEPSEIGKRFHSARLRNWEQTFTDSFYRAAVIVAHRMKKDHPETLGINMEEVILQAEELIKSENENRESARQDIGYRD